MKMLKRSHVRNRVSFVFVMSLITATLMVPVATTATAGVSGNLDNAFGERGVVMLSGGVVNESVLQSDQKLVSVAISPQRMVRHQSDGSLDASFGNGTGIVPAGDKSVAIQPDGKFVTADEVSVGFPRLAFRLQRFNSDGSLDTTFGNNGAAIAEYESLLEPMSVHGYDVTATDVVLQEDGKILIVGSYNYYHYDGFSYSRRPVAQALARFYMDGSPDLSFGVQGKLVSDTIPSTDPGSNPRETLNAVVVQTDGKIVVAGYLENDNLDMMVTRYNVDGTLDTLFGFNGVAVIDLGGVETGRDLALQADGNIVVVGRHELSGFLTADIAVVRLYSNGEIDSGFGVSGATITDYDGYQDGANAVALQSDGRIIIAGFMTASGKKGETDTVIGLARYTTDGALDRDFGRNGTVVTAIEGLPLGTANDVLVQADGKIIASGSAIVRYMP